MTTKYTDNHQKYDRHAESLPTCCMVCKQHTVSPDSSCECDITGREIENPAKGRPTWCPMEGGDDEA